MAFTERNATPSYPEATHVSLQQSLRELAKSIEMSHGLVDKIWPVQVVAEEKTFDDAGAKVTANQCAFLLRSLNERLSMLADEIGRL